jgi:hypothetical protein
MTGLPTWAPDWSHRESNPRHRPLPNIDIYIPEPSLNNFGPGRHHDIKGSALVLIATRLASISILSSVLDITFYVPSSDDHVWDACEWMARSTGSETILPRDRHNYIVYHIHSIQTLVQELRDYYQAHGSILDGRRLVILNKGSIALVPDYLQIGDHIYLTDGCTLPFVLRDTISDYESELEMVGSQFSAFQMVGACIFEMPSALTFPPRPITIY